jgi:hypothetical protein
VSKQTLKSFIEWAPGVVSTIFHFYLKNRALKASVLVSGRPF